MTKFSLGNSKREYGYPQETPMLNIIRLLNPVFAGKIIYTNRELLWQLIKRNIAGRYKGSALGLLWSFVQPLLMLCVYTFVFSVVFTVKWGVEMTSRSAFAIIMFCGIALYTIFSESIMASSCLILNNQNYVKKVIFPLEILTVAQVVSNFLLGTAWFLLLFLGVVFIYGTVSWTMLLLPLLLLPLFLYTLGISFLVTSLSVYIRDTQYILGVILQILFFMTPIFYPITAVPEQFRIYLQLNPLTVMIEEVRKIFIFGQLPDWTFFLLSLLIGGIVFQLGFAWFYKTKKGFADVL